MYSKQNMFIKLIKNFNNHASDVAATYCKHNIIFKPALTISLTETLVYVAGALAASYTIFALPVSAASLGSIDEINEPIDEQLSISREKNSSYLVKSQSPSKALEQVPLGFQDEFKRARAEAKKNRNKDFRFRYIQKGNIEGLTDSEQNGIGPGHGKSTAALEVAIAHKSLRSWKQVRVNALNHAVGKQSFNDFSNYINQQQKKAGLPKLTEFQLRNFMDISFWRTPEKGEPDMAKETGDSEYYQLPKLTPRVRASLFNTKLKYQEQIFREAVFTHDLTGRLLYKELTIEQDLSEAEAKFVSSHLNAVRFAKPANKTQALLRLGSEPYIQPLVDAKPGVPLFTFVPSGPPVAAAPPGTPPPILVPPSITGSPGILPPIFIPPDTSSNRSSSLPPIFIPPDTSSNRSSSLPPIFIPPDTSSSDRAAQPLVPPLTPSNTPQRGPAWNRMVVLVGIPVLALLPAILNGDDDDDDNSSTSTSSPLPDAGTCPTTSPALPTTEPVDGACPTTPPLVPVTEPVNVACSTTSPSVPVTEPVGACPPTPPALPPSEPVDGFPNTPPSSPVGELPTVDNPTLPPEVIDPGTTPIPEPASILGLIVAGTGLLVAKFRKLSNRKDLK